MLAQIFSQFVSDIVNSNFKLQSNVVSENKTLIKHFSLSLALIRSALFIFVMFRLLAIITITKV